MYIAHAYLAAFKPKTNQDKFKFKACFKSEKQPNCLFYLFFLVLFNLSCMPDTKKHIKSNFK